MAGPRLVEKKRHARAKERPDRKEITYPVVDAEEHPRQLDGLVRGGRLTIGGERKGAVSDADPHPRIDRPARSQVKLALGPDRVTVQALRVVLAREPRSVRIAAEHPLRREAITDPDVSARAYTSDVLDVGSEVTADPSDALLISAARLELERAMLDLHAAAINGLVSLRFLPRDSRPSGRGATAVLGASPRRRGKPT